MCVVAHNIVHNGLFQVFAGLFSGATVEGVIAVILPILPPLDLVLRLLHSLHRAAYRLHLLELSELVLSLIISLLIE